MRACWLLPLLLLSCREPAPLETIASTDTSIDALLACGPGVPVAHRGTSDGWPEPENSLAALERLIRERVPVAEIDVARSSDGTHFLYHDSEWEDDSTCEGDVAASRWDKASQCQLERDGQVSGERPPLLQDVLSTATGRIALEIDFKRSADYETVIRLVRAARMSDSVILIAYSNAQARKLSRLAPDMWVSVPENYPEFDPRRHFRWTDRDAPWERGPSIAFHPAANFTVSDRAAEMDWECGT